MQMQNYTAAPDGASVALIPEESAPACERCGKPFAPREGSGGRPQRFCSTRCRAAFHTEGQRGQRSPTCNVATEAAATPIAEPPKAAQEAAEAKLAAILAKHDEDRFDWSKDDSIVTERQMTIAIYFNSRDHLVIRREREFDEEEDAFICIAPQNIAAFIRRVCEVAGISAVGKR
jgi:hypothetical protein